MKIEDGSFSLSYWKIIAGKVTDFIYVSVQGRDGDSMPRRPGYMGVLVEICALFHRIAQLDNGEWSSERPCKPGCPSRCISDVTSLMFLRSGWFNVR